MENISDSSWICPDLYLDKVNVCATQCNRVYDGCKNEQDENDCPYKSHTLLLVGFLLLMLTLTFLLIELVFMMSRRRLEDNPPEIVQLGTVEKDLSIKRELKAIM